MLRLADRLVDGGAAGQRDYLRWAAASRPARVALVFEHDANDCKSHDMLVAYVLPAHSVGVVYCMHSCEMSANACQGTRRYASLAGCRLHKCAPDMPHKASLSDLAASAGASDENAGICNECACGMPSAV